MESHRRTWDDMEKSEEGNGKLGKYQNLEGSKEIQVPPYREAFSPSAEKTVKANLKSNHLVTSQFITCMVCGTAGMPWGLHSGQTATTLI